MRTRSGRDVSTDRSTQRSDNRNGAARTTRAAKRAPSDSELNAGTLETSVKRLKTQHIVAAMPIRQKKASASLPVPGRATDLGKAKATGDAHAPAETEYEIVSELVALVRNAALTSHHYGPVRAFLVNNSGICHSAKKETMTMWMQKVMQQLRAGDAAATTVNKGQHKMHVTHLSNSDSAVTNDNSRILPGWPRNVIAELTKLVRDASLPALNLHFVRAYIREVGQGAEPATLERWTRLVMQNLQRDTTGSSTVKADRNHASALANEEDDDIISELAAMGKDKSFIDLNNDNDNNNIDIHHAPKGRDATRSALNISDSSSANRNETEQQSFLEYSDAQAYAADPSIETYRREVKQRNYERKAYRKRTKEWNRKAPGSNIGAGRVMFTFEEAKEYLKNRPKLNITYDLQTGEQISFPVTRSYHLGAMGKYGGGPTGRERFF